MVAVVRVDSELVDDLEVVFAPVLEVHEGVVQRRAIIACKRIDATQGLGRGKHIRRDDFVQQAGEFGIGELDAVKCLEFLSEVLFERGTVSNIGTICEFEAVKL